MYINRKISPVESIPTMRGEGTKENDEGGKFTCDKLQELFLIYYFFILFIYE
jgi:hypothetical protein